MSEADTAEMIFTSVYEHKVDDKRRVPIPFRWRPKISVEFVLMLFPEKDVGEYLRVLPPVQWAKLLQEIKTMSPDEEQKAVLQRLVGRHAIEVRLDSAGRITLPETLAKAADITDDAVLAGNLYHFEIWSPARHKLVAENDKKEELNVLKRVRSL